MKQRPILAVPACEKGRGGGHLTRCIKLVCSLHKLGRETRLFLSADANTKTLFAEAGFDPAWLVSESDLHNINWEYIVLDRFRTSQKEFEQWTNLAPVIGIDEGGVCRDRFDFLIDILPNIIHIKPNIADPSLVFLPEKNIGNSKNKSVPLKVLITFGQEDAAGLGLVSANTLAKKNNNVIDITFLQGKLMSTNNSPLSLFKTVKTIPELNKHLHEYDLIITHYGITSFEALYANVPVLLVSPTSYHEKLTKAAGFFSAGNGKKAVAKLAKLLLKNGEVNLSFYRELKSRCVSLAEKHNLSQTQKKNLAEIINDFSPKVIRNCPACGNRLTGPDQKALARFPCRTYRQCKKCGVIFMDRLNPPPIEYGREYFFDFYQKQYGKTYIEDFPHLTAMAKRRIRTIKKTGKIKNGENPCLLDIGCAYGPFLAAAREEGFNPFGIDPAEDAVRYVTQTLGIQAVQGFFPDAALPHPHTAVTLWYVIEHFSDCVPAFAEIRKLLKPGGILAFATPSFSGISGRSSLKHFLERSPEDHWTIWSPASCKKALKTAGFKVKKIAVSGHHPERFPLLGKFASNPQSPLYRLLLTISKIFKLGDTFEVYAVNRGEKEAGSRRIQLPTT